MTGQKRSIIHNKNIFLMTKAVFLFLLSFMVFNGMAPIQATELSIKSIDGVAQYPEGYQPPRRNPVEDPFLNPETTALILIDYQPEILMGIKSMDQKDLINNTMGMLKAAKFFKIPVILSHVGVGSSGYKPFLKELREIVPEAKVIDRTNINAWEDEEFVAAVKALGRKKLVMGGLWTDVCLTYPAIEAIQAGYQVFVPEDVVGSVSKISHDNGMRRMMQAGVTPISWNVFLAEPSRDHIWQATNDPKGVLMNIYLKHLFKMDSWN